VGEWRYNFTILELNAASFTPRPLYWQVNRARYPLYRPQNWSRLRGGRTNFLPLSEIEPRFLGHPARSSSLYRLSYYIHLIVIVICQSPYGFRIPFLDLGSFFSFLILYTAGRTPWTERISPSQGHYLHTGQHKQNKRKQTSMHWVGFEPTIPAFERAKTVHASDRAATVTTAQPNSFLLSPLNHLRLPTKGTASILILLVGGSRYIASGWIQENPISIVIAQQYLDFCLIIRCSGNLFTKSLPSNKRLLWLRYSGVQTSCHNNNASEQRTGRGIWFVNPINRDPLFPPPPCLHNLHFSNITHVDHEDGGSTFLRNIGITRHYSREGCNLKIPNWVVE
jgi:hypothetical protein